MTRTTMRSSRLCACISGPLLAVATLAIAPACSQDSQPAAAARPPAPLIEKGAAAAGLPRLDQTSLALSESEIAAGAVEQRFAVSRAQAETWARHWVAANQELSGTPTVCLAVPWLDGRGQPVAHLFVLASEPACSSYQDIVGEVRRMAAETRAAGPPGGEQAPPGPGWELRERTRRSAERFFTLAVSAWSFRHPMQEGIKGLPLWLLTPERLPSQVAASGATPMALYYMGGVGGLVDVIEYQGNGQRFLYSHHSMTLVERGALTTTFDAASSYRRWRNLLTTRYQGQLAAKLAGHEKLWTRYLEEEKP